MNLYKKSNKKNQTFLFRDPYSWQATQTIFFSYSIIKPLNHPSYRNFQFYFIFFLVIHSTIIQSLLFFLFVPDRQLNKMPAAIIAVLTFYMYPNHSTNTFSSINKTRRGWRNVDKFFFGFLFHICNE